LVQAGRFLSVNQVSDEGLKLAVLSGAEQNGRYFIVFPEEGKTSTCKDLAGTMNNVPKYLSKLLTVFFLRSIKMSVTDHLRCPSQHSTALSVSKLGLQVGRAPSGKGVYAMKDGNGGLTGNPVGFIRDRTGFKQTGD
jgi:hypothetical protein